MGEQETLPGLSLEVVQDALTQRLGSLQDQDGLISHEALLLQGTLTDAQVNEVAATIGNPPWPLEHVVRFGTYMIMGYDPYEKELGPLPFYKGLPIEEDLTGIEGIDWRLEANFEEKDSGKKLTSSLRKKFKLAKWITKEFSEMTKLLFVDNHENISESLTRYLPEQHEHKREIYGNNFDDLMQLIEENNLELLLSKQRNQFFVSVKSNCKDLTLARQILDNVDIFLLAIYNFGLSLKKQRASFQDTLISLTNKQYDSIKKASGHEIRSLEKTIQDFASRLETAERKISDYEDEILEYKNKLNSYPDSNQNTFRPSEQEILLKEENAALKVNIEQLTFQKKELLKEIHIFKKRISDYELVVQRHTQENMKLSELASSLKNINTRITALKKSNTDDANNLEQKTENLEETSGDEEFDKGNTIEKVTSLPKSKQISKKVFTTKSVSEISPKQPSSINKGMQTENLLTEVKADSRDISCETNTIFSPLDASESLKVTNRQADEDNSEKAFQPRKSLIYRLFYRLLLFFIIIHMLFVNPYFLYTVLHVITSVPLVLRSLFLRLVSRVEFLSDLYARVELFMHSISEPS